MALRDRDAPQEFYTYVPPSLDDDSESLEPPPERVKAKSEPAVAIGATDEQDDTGTPGKVTKQVSAPSHLISLTENDAPPFRKPLKEPRPKLLIGTIMNERDAVHMIAASEADPEKGLIKFLGHFVIEKNLTENFNLSERDFLVSLLIETIGYAAQRDFSARKLTVLITIYLATHRYFKYYYWSAPVAVWSYFKELMIRHTIEDSPEGEEVFEPEECYDILTHFHTMYISNMPLVHIRTFGVYQLKFEWPFKKIK